jgi:hypothetical protein
VLTNPHAQTVYDRSLAVALEYPGLVVTQAQIHGNPAFCVANEHMARGPAGPIHYPFLRLMVRNELIAAEVCNHSFDFDTEGFKAVAQPYGEDSADRAERIMRVACDSLSAIVLPETYRYRSQRDFVNMIVEKGADGLYRERVAEIDADMDIPKPLLRHPASART